MADVPTFDERVAWLRSSAGAFRPRPRPRLRCLRYQQPCGARCQRASHAAGEGAREIGYWVHVDHVGQGYASELAAALTKVAGTYVGVNQVKESACDPDDVSSTAIHQEARLRARGHAAPALDGLARRGARHPGLQGLLTDACPGSAQREIPGCGIRRRSPASCSGRASRALLGRAGAAALSPYRPRRRGAGGRGGGGPDSSVWPSRPSGSTTIAGCDWPMHARAPGRSGGEHVRRRPHLQGAGLAGGDAVGAAGRRSGRSIWEAAALAANMPQAALLALHRWQEARGVLDVADVAERVDP